MTTPTCRICGQPVHRYSPDHPGTSDDLMGCVNSLRGALEEVEVERDRYRDVVDAAMQIFARRYVVGGGVPHGLIAVDDDAVGDLNKALQTVQDAGGWRNR